MADILPAEVTLEFIKEHSLTSALKTELERLIFDGKIKAGERIKELHLFRLQGLYAGGATTSNVEHARILKAIKAGDADGAGQAMRNHIEAARIRMRRAARAARAMA